jgi:hypothetical protein
MAMSTFDTNAHIIQEDGIGKESWFDGDILKRSGPIVYSETKNFALFMDHIGFMPLFWVHYIQTSDIKGRSLFDDVEIILHMRLNFTKLTGISEFVISSDVSFLYQLFGTVFSHKKRVRTSLATSACPKKEHQVLIDQFIASLNSSWLAFEIPL